MSIQPTIAIYIIGFILSFMFLMYDLYLTRVPRRIKTFDAPIAVFGSIASFVGLIIFMVLFSSTTVEIWNNLFNKNK